jgi:NitT/TauT family transport system ATP-binding protein
MKQRVEIARALACRPDVLFMDEPFGALDYLTRLRLRAELVDLWQRDRPTVLFVTHDVEEAVQLADCIVVLSPRPARLRRLVPVALPRPRDPDTPAYLELRDQVLELLGVDRLGRDPGGAAAQEGISGGPPPADPSGSSASPKYASTETPTRFEKRSR